MARPRIHVRPYLSASDLFRYYRSSKHPEERSRWQTIWLLSRMDEQRSIEEVASLVGFSPDWVRKLVRRYNAQGPQALKAQPKVRSGGPPPLLTPAQQALLRKALESPPLWGGTWSGPKVARWITLVTGVKPSTVTGWTYMRRLSPDSVLDHENE